MGKAELIFCWYQGVKVCQGNIPHTMTPASTTETNKDRCMFLCCLHEILTLPFESCITKHSSPGHVFLKFYITQFSLAGANCRPCLLFLTDKCDTWCGCLLLSPCASRFNVCSKMLFCIPRL